MELKGKKVTVLGAGETGLQSALFLAEQGARVYLSELKTEEKLKLETGRLSKAGIEFAFGGHDWNEIRNSELVIISPGICPSVDLYQHIVRARIPIWSEIELAYRFCPSEIIAITGTSGKTTVSHLIRNALLQGGRLVTVCGNIGNAFVREVNSMSPSALAVVEVSSFQLVHIDQFRPHVSVLLNLSANHLDWHADYEEYARAKCRIFKNQGPDDIAVINGTDEECVLRTRDLNVKKVFFDRTQTGDLNRAVVKAVADLYHVDEAITERVLDEFIGLEHRFEDLGTYREVRYINDSKSTTVASLRWALDRAGKGVILIVGGTYKGGDLASLRTDIQRKVRAMIALGASKHLWKDAFSDLIPIHMAASLEEAMDCARRLSHPGETVLFSPACSSFDMFRDYKDRGERFKSILAQWREALAPI